MEIRKHKDCDAILSAPADMQDGSCDALPVMLHGDKYGAWACSFWKPSQEELQQLRANGTIVLMVRVGANDGTLPNLIRHPVVQMGVTIDPTEPA